MGICWCQGLPLPYEPIKLSRYCWQRECFCWGSNKNNKWVYLNSYQSLIKACLAVERWEIGRLCRKPLRVSCVLHGRAPGQPWERCGKVRQSPWEQGHGTAQQRREVAWRLSFFTWFALAFLFVDIQGSWLWCLMSLVVTETILWRERTFTVQWPKNNAGPLRWISRC